MFDSAVGTTDETKVLPIQNGELLRLNIGTAPVLSKVSNVKSNKIQVDFRRPVCLFEGENVAISRRIAERWRLIGAGIVGWRYLWYKLSNSFSHKKNQKYW